MAPTRRTRPPGTTNSRKGAGLAFLKMVAAETPDGLCRDWPYGTLKGGYGQVMLRGRVTSAHRAMLIILTGENEPGSVARHTCDRPVCVAPWHLLWGTQSENTVDAFERNRRYQNTGERTCAMCGFKHSPLLVGLHQKKSGHEGVI